MGLLERALTRRARRAHDSARKLYLRLYQQALEARADLDLVDQHVYAAGFAAANTGPYMTEEQHGAFEATALAARADRLPAGSREEFLRAVLAAQWAQACDGQVEETTQTVEALTGETDRALVAAWVAQWCVFVAVQTTPLARYEPTGWFTPDLARASVDAVSARMGVAPAAVLEIVDGLSISEPTLREQIVAWAIQARYGRGDDPHRRT